MLAYRRPSLLALLIAAGSALFAGGWLYFHRAGASDLAGSWGMDVSHSENALYQKGDTAYVDASTSASALPAPTLAVYDDLGAKVADLPAPTPGTDGHYHYALPTDRLGYFEVKPTANATDYIPALGTRPAGELTYAVVNPFSTDPSNGFVSLQGMTGKGNAPMTPNYLAAYPYLGVTGGLSKYYSMNYLEPTGPIDLAAKLAGDTDPAQWQQAHVQPYFSLFNYPDWAIDQSTLLKGALAAWEKWHNTTTPPASYSSLLPPKLDDNLRAYLRAVATHIAATYDFMPTHRYQLTWEPDTDRGRGWLASDQDIVNFYAFAYPILHQYDPKAVVIGPTLGDISRAEMTQQEDILKLGLGNYIDEISIHPYTDSNGRLIPTRTFGDLLNTLTSWTARYTNGRTVPITSTEFGVLQTPTEASMVNQGKYLSEALISFKETGWKMATLFYLSDFGQNNRYGFTYNLSSGNLDAYPGKTSPKITVPLVRQAADMVAAATPAGMVDQNDADIDGAIFLNKDATRTVAIWDRSGLNRTVTLKVGAGTVTAQDRFGNPLNIPLQNGVATLALTDAPLYLTGMTTDAVAQPGAMSLDPELSVRLNLPNRAPTDQYYPGNSVSTYDKKYKISVAAYPAGSTAALASVDGITSGPDGSFSVRDKAFTSALSDSGTYDLLVTVPGYLPRLVTGVKNPLSRFYEIPASGWHAGDVDLNQKITLADILHVKGALNGEQGIYPTIARQISSQNMSLADLITVIRNYNAHPNADLPGTQP